MKTIWLFSFLVIAFTGFAQGFEGTIKWSIKYEVTDPQKKAEMEKAQKAMSDPANQEKMKKMQEQMNSPEMKAMMEANPQLKTRMEATMKMMQGGGDPMAAAMPTSFIIKTKGNNSLSKMEGGMMGSETLYLGDKKLAYLINRSAKTYTVMNANSTAGPRKDSIQRKVTKTTETMKILNYTCTKYIVELRTDKGAINQVFWTTPEVKGLDMSSFSRQRMGNSGQSFYYEGMSGVPLRMETGLPQMNMIMEVTDIKKEVLPAGDFAIPTDFKETKGFGG